MNENIGGVRWNQSIGTSSNSELVLRVPTLVMIHMTFQEIQHHVSLLLQHLILNMFARNADTLMAKYLKWIKTDSLNT